LILALDIHMGHDLCGDIAAMLISKQACALIPVARNPRAILKHFFA